MTEAPDRGCRAPRHSTMSLCRLYEVDRPDTKTTMHRVVLQEIGGAPPNSGRDEAPDDVSVSLAHQSAR
jgi:hypothetical protein